MHKLIDDSRGTHKKKRKPTMRARARHKAVKMQSKLKMNREKLHQAFQHLDDNGDGRLNLAEFLAACQTQEDDAEAIRLFHMLDEDGSGDIECAELVHAMRTNKEAVTLARRYESLEELVRLSAVRAKRRGSSMRSAVGRIRRKKTNQASAGGKSVFSVVTTVKEDQEDALAPSEGAELAAALKARMSRADKARHGLTPAAGPRSSSRRKLPSIRKASSALDEAKQMRSGQEEGEGEEDGGGEGVGDDTKQQAPSYRPSADRNDDDDEQQEEEGDSNKDGDEEKSGDPAPPANDREALVRLYTRCDPSKLDNVDLILGKFPAGNRERMYDLLAKLYPGETIERPVSA